MPRIYNWNKVDKKTGKVLSTERQVSIDAFDAEELNVDWKITGIRYDLIKGSTATPVVDDKPDENAEELEAERQKLMKDLRDLGGNAGPNAKIETLKLKIEEIKKQKK